MSQSVHSEPPKAEKAANGVPGESLAAFLRQAIEEGKRFTAHLPKPIASVIVHREGFALDVCLDTSKAEYGDWIKGEGADISISRDEETHKVNGARLPLYAKTLIISGDFGSITIDIEKGTMEVDVPELAFAPTGGHIDSKGAE